MAAVPAILCCKRNKPGAFRRRAVVDPLLVVPRREDPGREFLLETVQNKNGFGEPDGVDRPMGVASVGRDDFENAGVFRSIPPGEFRERPVMFLRSPCEVPSAPAVPHPRRN